MSDYVLLDEQRKQIAAEYLIAARNNTEHELVAKLAQMPTSDYKEQYAKVLANAYEYEIQALVRNKQSDQPKDESYIQNYTAKQIAENGLPPPTLSHSQVLKSVIDEGAHDRIVMNLQQLEGQDAAR